MLVLGFLIWIIGGILILIFRERLALKWYEAKRDDDYDINKTIYIIKLLKMIVVILTLLFLFMLWITGFPSFTTILFHSRLTLFLGQIFLFSALIIYLKESVKVYQDKESSIDS